jgi:hypothetical protein
LVDENILLVDEKIYLLIKKYYLVLEKNVTTAPHIITGRYSNTFSTHYSLFDYLLPTPSTAYFST